MVSFSDIAIFVLATTRGTRKVTDGPYYNRILPMVDTWGYDYSIHDRLHFMFGNNNVDEHFIKNNCRKRLDLTINNNTVNISMIGKADWFYCPGPGAESTMGYSNIDTNIQNNKNNESNNRKKLKEISAIHTSDCPGTYFGIGPTCRCDRAIHLYLYHPIFERVNWFIFMDDDVYIRPYALLSFLNQFPVTSDISTSLSTTSFTLNTSSSNSYRNNSDNSCIQRPYTIVFPEKVRGFSFSRKNIKELGVHNCTNHETHDYVFAQPILMERLAVLALVQDITSSSNSNNDNNNNNYDNHNNNNPVLWNDGGLMSLQSHWGGSHDAILGMLIYIRHLPVATLTLGYVGKALTWSTNLDRKRIGNRFNSDITLFFHQVRRLPPKSPPKSRKVHAKSSQVGADGNRHINSKSQTHNTKGKNKPRNDKNKIIKIHEKRLERKGYSSRRKITTTTTTPTTITSRSSSLMYLPYITFTQYDVDYLLHNSNETFFERQQQVGMLAYKALRCMQNGNVHATLYSKNIGNTFVRSMC